MIGRNRRISLTYSCVMAGVLLVLLAPGVAAAQPAASDPPAAVGTNPALFEHLWPQAAQDAVAIPDFKSPECPGCPKRSWGRALIGTIGTNVVFNLVNLAFRPEDRHEFQVTPMTWWDNLKAGYIFDDNQFMVNQFGHPYQGGLYFNSGRANGLNYWESSVLAALGSFTWECCGETNQGSINDFYSTTMGGMVLGEITHRLAGLVRDNAATSHRGTREIAAMAIDPVGGAWRLINGDWGKVQENPPDMRPEVLSVSAQAGALWRGAGGTLEEANAYPYVEVDFGYGDFVRTPWRKPFDAFQTRFVLGGGKGISELVVIGRLYGKALGDSPKPTSRFILNQGFAFLSNPAYELGGQSVAGGVAFVQALGRQTNLYVMTLGQFVPLAAISAEDVGVNERTYDYGPALGANVVAALRWKNDPVLRFYYQSSFIKTVNGSGATHNVHMLQGRAELPLGKTLGAGGSFTWFKRNSHYPTTPDTSTTYPESRLFLSIRF
jgi:hypothetical protein